MRVHHHHLIAFHHLPAALVGAAAAVAAAGLLRPAAAIMSDWQRDADPEATAEAEAEAEGRARARSGSGGSHKGVAKGGYIQLTRHARVYVLCVPVCMRMYTPDHLIRAFTFFRSLFFTLTLPYDRDGGSGAGRFGEAEHRAQGPGPRARKGGEEGEGGRQGRVGERKGLMKESV